MELRCVIEKADVACADVHSHIDFARLKSHGARIRVVNRGNLDRLIRHFAIPVMRILLHDRLFLGEGFADVRTRANRTLLREVALAFRRRIDDEEERVSEEARHVRLRLLRRDDEILPVRLYFLILEERLGTLVLGESALDGRLDRFRRQILAVRELHAVADLERPRQVVVADLPALRQPRLHVHLLVKLRQGLTHAIAHDGPAEIVLRRLQAVGEIRHADLERRSVRLV